MTCPSQSAINFLNKSLLKPHAKLALTYRTDTLRKFIISHYIVYRLLDVGASSPDPAGLKMGCQSFRFGTGTELSHLMRDREEFWLKMGLHPLLSQHFCCVRQVIWSHRTPADLRWIIVNSKGNSGAHICGLLRWQEDTGATGWEDGLCRLSWNSMRVDGEFSLPFMLLRHHQVDSFVRLASSSSSSLPSSSSTSCLILLSRYFEWSWVQRMSFCKCLTHWSLKHGPSGCFVCALLFKMLAVLNHLPVPGLCASSSPKLHLHSRGGSPVLHCWGCQGTWHIYTDF